jgi:hypothetical protein
MDSDNMSRVELRSGSMESQRDDMQDHLHAPWSRRRGVQYRSQRLAGTLMRHALSPTGAIGPLSISVVGPTLGACLVPVPGPLDLLPSRYDATIVRTVTMAPIAPTADVKVVAAPAASPPPKLLHPTPRAEEVSTGDPRPIIISSETKRLHPRGDSAATGSPVSSTGGDDPRPVPATRPVSGPA